MKIQNQITNINMIIQKLKQRLNPGPQNLSLPKQSHTLKDYPKKYAQTKLGITLSEMIQQKMAVVLPPLFYV